MGEIADALRRSALHGSGDPDPGGAGLAPSLLSDPRLELRAGGREPQALGSCDRAIHEEGGAEREACRQVALRLRSELQRYDVRSVAVVSALRDEGKTTTSCNLALSLASLDTDRRVALVGLDLRRPGLVRALGIDVRVGVEEVLAGGASLEAACITIEDPALDVFPAMTPQRNAHEILTVRHLSEFIRELERRYNVVIVDTPPVLLVPDTRLILEHVPLCVPVARTGRTRVRSFREMLDMLPQHQILGTLLNGTRRSSYYYEYPHYASEPDSDEDLAEPQPSRRRRRRVRPD